MKLKTPKPVYYLAYCTGCGATFFPSLSPIRRATKSRALIAVCACGKSDESIRVAKYVIALRKVHAPRRRVRSKERPS